MSQETERKPEICRFTLELSDGCCERKILKHEELCSFSLEPCSFNITRNRRLAKLQTESPAWFWPNQYYSSLNYQAQEATAREIFDQTKATVTHVVCATGTAGTAVGLAYAFRKLKPEVRVGSRLSRI